MGSDLTAAQLAEIVGPVRDLLPDGALSSSFAEEVCEAVLTRRLANSGYQIDMSLGVGGVQLTLTDYNDCEAYYGEPMPLLQALVSAAVAARTEKK